MLQLVKSHCDRPECHRYVVNVELITDGITELILEWSTIYIYSWKYRETIRGGHTSPCKIYRYWTLSAGHLIVSIVVKRHTENKNKLKPDWSTLAEEFDESPAPK